MIVNSYKQQLVQLAIIEIGL